MKRLVLVGLSAIALAACGGSQEQVEADVESSAVESVSSESEADDTSITPERTNQAFVELTDKLKPIEMGEFLGSDKAGGATVDEVVEALGDYTREQYNKEDDEGVIKSSYIWDFPRSQQTLNAEFEDDSVVRFTYFSDRYEEMTAEDFESITTDSTIDENYLIENFGAPYYYGQVSSGSYLSTTYTYRAEDHTDDSAHQYSIYLDDGVVTNKDEYVE